jgi:hypothetical protein
VLYTTCLVGATSTKGPMQWQILRQPYTNHVLLHYLVKTLEKSESTFLSNALSISEKSTVFLFFWGRGGRFPGFVCLPWWEQHVGEDEYGVIVECYGRKQKYSRHETCPSANLRTTNLTWTKHESKQGLRSDRPATNCLGHGMVSNTGLQLHLL